jgi:hypothetical protein
VLVFSTVQPTGQPLSYTVLRTDDGAVYSPSAKGYSQSGVADGSIPLPESGVPGLFVAKLDVPKVTSPAELLVVVKSGETVVDRILVNPDPNPPSGGSWAQSL